MESHDGLAARAATVAQVLVADVNAPVLDADDHHHLSKVLRVREGEAVSVIDGAGWWRICKWQGGLLVGVSTPQFGAEPAHPIAVAFPPLKGDRTELVVQKLTELGVDAMVLLSTDRGVVQWGAKGEKVLTRLRRVSKEAALQSRCLRLPSLDGLHTVAEAVSKGFALTQWGGSAVDARTHPRLAVGPEGGWSNEELAAASNFVSLGSTVLRAETAAIAGGVLLSNTRVAGLG